MFVSEALAHHAIETNPSIFSETVWLAAERALLDTLAALVGGVPTENALVTRHAAQAAFGAGESSAWLTSDRLHPLGALLANCAAASALDIDDGHRAAAGHPGAAIIPAAIMEAARLDVSGEDLLGAIIIGYDAAIRVAEARRRSPDVSYASGIWTGYGVAAALSRLRGLTPRQTAHAIAIAGQEAPQNLPQGACMASSVKGSSPWSTVTASVAVARAESGATGSLDLLDRNDAYQPGMLNDLGERWPITEIYLKPYAACRYVHPVIDAILDLVGPTGTGQIDELFVEIFPESERLPNSIAPTSLEDAQFSIPFAAALAAVGGGSALRPVRPEALSDKVVLELSRRVKVTYAAEFAGVFPHETPARVTIKKDGLKRSKEIPIPLGDPRRALPNELIELKFLELARDHFHKEHAERVIYAVSSIRDSDTKQLYEALTSKSEQLQCGPT